MFYETDVLTSYVKAFKSLYVCLSADRLTDRHRDRQTDRYDRNYVSYCFTGGQLVTKKLSQNIFVFKALPELKNVYNLT